MRYLPQFLLSIVIALTACASGALANCPEHQVRRAEQVRLTGDSVLFVVHASSTYDARFTSKRCVDEAVRFAKMRGIQVVYLQDDSIPRSNGRPGGEHWPKLSLLETMGLIVREERQLQYLEHVLPRWENTFPGQYQVELSLNGERKKVLRKASGLMSSTLRFEFYDSALSIDPVR